MYFDGAVAWICRGGTTAWICPGWDDGGCLLNSDFSVPSHASINCPLAQTVACAAGHPGSN